MLKLSIIIPIYNVEPYISDCLESVLAQINPNIEVILINDGTPDNSMVIVEDIINKCSKDQKSRFNIINQLNQGPSIARNTGLKLAKGKYIAFLDSDDKLLPKYIEHIFKEIESADYDIIDFNILTSTNDVIRLRSSGEDNLDSVFKAGTWYNCARVIKRDLFNKHKFTPDIYYEDLALIPLLYLEANSIRHIDTPLYWYRRNEEGITNTISSENNKKTFDSLQQIMDHYLGLFNKTGNPYHACIALNSLYLLHNFAVVRVGLKDCFKLLRQNDYVFNNVHFRSFVHSNSISKRKYKIFYSFPKLFLATNYLKTLIIKKLIYKQIKV